MTRLYSFIQSYVATSLPRNEEGQASAEYALVIVGAATIAGLLITWATGNGAIGNLFGKVVKKVTDGVGG